MRVVVLSLSGSRAPLPLLEALSVPKEDMSATLRRLAAQCGSTQVALICTCHRVELCAVLPDGADGRELVEALAEERTVSSARVALGGRVLVGPAAVRHVLRVASGLESFVLGENEIAGQVRNAAQQARAAGTSGAELSRLFDWAARTSRAVRTQTTLSTTRRSVAVAALETAVTRLDGITGRRVLVVGAGQVATAAVAAATALGARTTVANRSSHRAGKLEAMGARVVDLGSLGHELSHADVAVMATSSPHPLVDASMLKSLRAGGDPLLLLDLCLPRNVHPSARRVAGVSVVDLDELRRGGTGEAAALVGDLATAEATVDRHVEEYGQWLRGRAAASALRRQRLDVDRVVSEEAARILTALPPEHHDLVYRALVRTAHRLAHGPTVRLRAAAERGDTGVVDELARVFRPLAEEEGRGVADPAVSAVDEPDAAGVLDGPLLHLPRRHSRPLEQPAHQRSIHPADDLTVTLGDLGEDTVA